MALMMNSCSQVDGANPSQNKTVNAIAGKKETKRSGYMQQALDKWLAEEWSPLVSGTQAPTGDTKVKIIPKDDGSATLVEADTGVVLKEMTKEQVQRQKEVQAKYKEDDRPFTLQEYVDKIAVYHSTTPSDPKNSHTTKINAMPVIGKKEKYVDGDFDDNSTESHHSKVNSLPGIGKKTSRR